MLFEKIFRIYSVKNLLCFHAPAAPQYIIVTNGKLPKNTDISHENKINMADFFENNYSDHF